MYICRVTSPAGCLYWRLCRGRAVYRREPCKVVGPAGLCVLGRAWSVEHRLYSYGGLNGFSLAQRTLQAEHVKYSTLTAALFGFLLSAVANAEPYRIITEEWAPYNYLENNHISGMTTDIVRAIMAFTGDDFGFEVVPSMRASYALQRRPKTIMYSMFRTPERESLYKWVGPIVEEAIYPYQLADAEPQINTLQELLQAPRITTRTAGLIPDTLQSQGFTNLDRSAAGTRQLYQMLVAGRTAIIVGDTAAGMMYQSRQLNIAPGTLRQIPVELYRSSLYIAFSRDADDKIVAAWSHALQTLRHSGELDRIKRKYYPLAGQ